MDKPGAIVIDVGINRVPAGHGKTRLVGDVHFESARPRSERDHPRARRRWANDGGLLMANTCRAAFLRHGLPWKADI